jgi:hypothetical protein
MTYSIGSLNAGMILGRFGASAVVCRCIAAYELAGMRAAKKFEKSGVAQETNVMEIVKRRVVSMSEGSADKDATRSRPTCLVQGREELRIAGHSATM